MTIGDHVDRTPDSVSLSTKFWTSPTSVKNLIEDDPPFLLLLILLMKSFGISKR